MTSEPYRNPQRPIEERVEDLLGRMTLEEKVAQISSLEREAAGFDDQGNPVDAAVREMLHHGIGIIGRPAMKYPPAQGARRTNGIQRFLIEQTRLGIPALLHEEALHGLMASGATSFPNTVGLASTWDPELVRSVYAAAALEMRSRGSNIALTPDLDLGREPRWGRVEETFGEDPYLVSRMGAAAVRGLQGEVFEIDQRHVMATAKHYAVHGQPEGGRNCAPGNIAQREVIEHFLKPFEAAVREAGVGAVMASYNEIDGIPSHANPWLLRQVLREAWGFDGFVISDGDGVNHLYRVHRLTASKAEAARLALEAGIQLEIPGEACFGTLVEQVRSGQVQEGLLDEAVGRVLSAKFRLGLFEQPYVDPDIAEQVNNSEQHRQLALEAARKAVILLKNEGELLPLDRTRLRRIAVIGPNARDLHLGGYSYDPGRGETFLEGVQAAAGEDIAVEYAEGCRITERVRDWRGWWEDDIPLSSPGEQEHRIAEAVELARWVDVVVLVLGENEATCREAWSEKHLGDRDSLDLLGRQQDLAEAVLETGTPTIVALINGRPLAIHNLAQKAPAILECWYLGQEGGTAFAEVLFGEVNPSGKLPITIPRSAGQLPAYYYHKPSANRSYLAAENGPLFPFGFGLTYSYFAYENLRLSAASITRTENVIAQVEVTNTGSRPGDEIVQLYIRDLYASVTRPVMELVNFRRITLYPGERRTVEFTIQPQDLSFLGHEMTRVVEPGTFEVMVGPHSDSLLRAHLEVVPD